MPIKIPKGLPAGEILHKENIFVMDEERAITQDIRPLQIAVLNLMPLKEQTETQLLRMLSNTPLQMEITFLTTASYVGKNTAQDHLSNFYKKFAEVKERKFDGMIITGAPVEQMVFEEVEYWQELVEIMDWTKSHVTSVFHICWGAQAALYHRYGIKKYPLDKKLFGVFAHRLVKEYCPLTRGFDAEFWVPHSRHTTVHIEDIAAVKELELVAVSNEAGAYLILSKDGRNIFVTGHSEYDALTLKQEYDRDKGKGLAIDLPKNYFPEDNPYLTPKSVWSSHANLLYSNWLNYYVYQRTPYEIERVGEN